MIASPRASCLRTTPGPLLIVMAKSPAKAAPMVELAAEISSSAWKVLTLNSRCRETSCRMSLAGVMGYAPRKTG